MSEEDLRIKIAKILIDILIDAGFSVRGGPKHADLVVSKNQKRVKDTKANTIISAFTRLAGYCSYLGIRYGIIIYPNPSNFYIFDFNRTILQKLEIARKMRISYRK